MQDASREIIASSIIHHLHFLDLIWTIFQDATCQNLRSKYAVESGSIVSVAIEALRHLGNQAQYNEIDIATL
jgi:hypothetical protein